MRYYVYFDSYRRPRKAVSEKELKENYRGEPDEFLRSMIGPESCAPADRAVGHVGVMRFDDERDLQAFMDATGEEIAGFYECREDCRPYNF
ncbi:MAG: hypothetical protein JXL84_00505 [Deltaproteobacteria bacterium]|nr:hypothetical protein [Deltaproteobacteria bacterium]